jgi:hypothetical protein
MLLGLPIAFVALQLVAGRRRVWLPRPMRERSIAHADFARILGHAMPTLERLERLLRPRLQVFSRVPGPCLIGFAILLLALMLALPVPLTNIPLAVAIILLALGLIARDGLVIVLGYAASILAVLAIVLLGKTTIDQLGAYLGL